MSVGGPASGWFRPHQSSSCPEVTEARSWLDPHSLSSEDAFQKQNVLSPMGDELAPNSVCFGIALQPHRAGWHSTLLLL